jgi:hypothetical protein
MSKNMVNFLLLCFLRKYNNTANYKNVIFPQLFAADFDTALLSLPLKIETVRFSQTWKI